MRYIVLIASCLALAACHKAPALEGTVTPVRVVAVEMYQPRAGARYSASILPGRQVNLAFRVSGLVSEIHRTGNRGLEPGDNVAGGTVLARLRAEDFDHSAAQAQSQIEAAKESQKSAAAQVAQAKASQVKAEADFGRARTLFDTQSLTRPDLDAARAQLDVAAAQVAAASAQLDAAAAQIRNTEASLATARLAKKDAVLVAPFAATVVQRNVEIGTLAGPSLTAYALADIGTVKAAFGVPDTVVVQIRPGRALAISVTALAGRDFRGKVTSVGAVADSATRLFQVEVTIANGGHQLKPGMIASLELESGAAAPQVPVVPVSAVVRDPKNATDFAVMVVEGKVARARKVSLGETFGELLAVTSGLKPGERVIRAGATMVNDGEAVEVIP